MIDIRDRIRCAALQDRIVSAEEAASAIKDGMTLGTSGFTPAGYPKAVPLALAARAKTQGPFKIHLWTGASTGRELDGALAEAGSIASRLPYQTNDSLRKAINSGDVEYADIHLSHVARQVRCGSLKRHLDVAIVEACAITEEGNIVPTTSVGNSPTFVAQADMVIVEINTSQPAALEGMHDVYIPRDPPFCAPIPIINARDRIGTPYIPASKEKITYIVPCDIGDAVKDFAPVGEDETIMAALCADFLHAEVRAGRLPKGLLPLQSGVGSVSNAILAGLVYCPLSQYTCYTEVIQDGMLDLIDAGKLDFASGSSITPSPAGLRRFYADIERYKKKIILRPQEISNSPEVARRLGVIAMNTAIEADIFGNINSTHIMGTRMMNGIGGSGDFARNAYCTIFFTSSVAKQGLISSIVPMCSHIDHTEHDVSIVITEQGIADLRGLSPRQRARAMIAVAHPDYRPALLDYLERAERQTHGAHTPHILAEALSWHTRYITEGRM